ncbi:unnamed protein product, partial [Aphanomyces euteiches]
MSMKPKTSSKAFKWVNQLFHVHSFYAMDKEEEAALPEAVSTAELGWGFFPDRTSDASGTKYIPVMLLHVIGDHHALKSFVESFADVVIVELEDEQAPCGVKLARGWVIQYAQSDADTCEVKKKTPNIRKVLCGFDCSASRILKQLYKYQTKIESKTGGEHARRKLLGDVIAQSESIPRQVDKKNQLGSLLGFVDFRTVRCELRMQLKFAEYAQDQVQRLREAERDEFIRALLSIEQEHYEAYQAETLRPNSTSHVLMIELVRLLSWPSADERVARVMHLERLLRHKCKPNLDLAMADEREARNRKNTEPYQQTMIEEWQQCVEKTNMSSVGLVHLWREISHIYAANPAKPPLLANLAAQHLLDGFPLEMMDGDAGAVNVVWIQGVLEALSAVLGSATVLVLSILGIQSSGKSTLFNVMFGVRLQTGAGRCTRGVSMQLIKCEGHSEYEYILLLDTEGVRASDFIGLEENVWRDNRMATFAIVPADATIILTKGESTTEINDMLPIMLTAYQRSDLAEEHGGILPSKLLFVFNQNNTNQSANLSHTADTLRTELNKNAQNVDQILKPSAPATATSHAFSDVRVDMTNMDRSDMRVLGTLTASDSPPNDTPNAAFGSDVLRLRNYIHSCVVNDDKWKARTMGQFAKMFSLFNNFIELSDFEFNFTAAVERLAYDELVHKIESYMEELTTAYWVQFEAITKKITTRAYGEALDKPNANTDEQVENVVGEFSQNLDDNMKTEISRLGSAVAALETDKRYKKWWSSYQDKHWKQWLRDCVAVKFKYNVVVENYKRTFRRQTNDLFSGGKWESFTEDQKDKEFDRIFDKLVEEAQRDHEPHHLKVPVLVSDVFMSTETASESVSDYWSGSNKEDVVETIRRRVNNEIAKAKVYSDQTVKKCIKIAQDAFNSNQVKSEVRGEYYLRLRETLQKELEEKQLVWDKNNNIASRFQATRAEMRRYFDLLGKGCQGMEVFQDAIANWLSQGLQNAFVEEFVKFIGDSVKDSRWVRDAKVLQALLDEHLINEIRANRIQNVLDHLGDPKNHIITVLWKLFSKKIEVCAADRLEVFRKVIQEGINSPAASASAARCDRAAEFRKHLLEQLRTGLQSGSTNRFLDSLPDLSGPAFHFDEQPNEVFVESDDSYVCKPVLDVVSKELTSLAKAYEGVNACGDLSEKVLEYIKLASYGIDHGVRPRCGEPCPLCKCPCTREYGHNEKEPKTRHDTIHQPGGLTKEGYRMENMELFAPN